MCFKGREQAEQVGSTLFQSEDFPTTLITEGTEKGKGL